MESRKVEMKRSDGVGARPKMRGCESRSESNALIPMSELPREHYCPPGIATINHFRNRMTSNATRQRSYRTTIIEIGIDPYANNRREVKLRPL